MTRASLIILSGLPGVGKTTIARELAGRIRAVHIRIDSIEQAIRESALRVQAAQHNPIGDEGYRVGYALAADNLRLGHTVVADSVNPLPITRDAWRAVGVHANVRVVEVEVVCSSREEHRRRLESRVDEVEGLKRVTWQEVVDRDDRPWTRSRSVIDTATASLDDAVRAIRSCLEG